MSDPAPFGQIKIRGKRFIFTDDIDDNHDANVDPPGTPNRAIHIRPHIAYDSKYLLEIILHESIHGALWDLAEEAVSETAKDLAVITLKTIKYKPT